MPGRRIYPKHLDHLTREEATKRLLKAITFYYAEYQRCDKANAWFASASMGAACCESAMLLLCIKFETEIRSNTATSAPPGEAYLTWLFGRNLFQLCKIALAMKWITTERLPSRSRDLFRATMYHVADCSPDEDRRFDQAVDVELDYGLANFVLNMVRTTRNLVHPGKCAKEAVSVSAFADERIKSFSSVWQDVFICLQTYMEERSECEKGSES